MPDEADDYKPAPLKASVNAQLHGDFNFGGARKARHAGGKLRESRERKRVSRSKGQVSAL
jgi:hypothetical protein